MHFLINQLFWLVILTLILPKETVVLVSMSDYNISAVPLAADSPTPYTYFNDSLLCSSHIDHFIVSKTLENLVSPARTQNSGANLSDHLPLSVRNSTYVHAR